MTDGASDPTSQTVGALVRDAASRLAAVGVDTARLDARLLLCRATDRTRADLMAADRDPVDPTARSRFETLVVRRLAREPIAHILGEREFWSLPFRVTRDTLVPRPDSETLVAAVLRHRTGRAAGTVLDLGTGTGCLLLALLREWPEAFGVGLDCSAAAVKVAQDNARSLGVGDRSAFVVGDWAAALAAQGGAGFDVIVSNPPYIPTRDVAGLQPEVRDYDPRLALDGGADGLEAYRQIVPVAAGLLANAGTLALEVGENQAEDVATITRGAGFAAAAIYNDLGGRGRTVVAEIQ